MRRWLNSGLLRPVNRLLIEISSRWIGNLLKNEPAGHPGLSLKQAPEIRIVIKHQERVQQTIVSKRRSGGWGSPAIRGESCSI